MVGSLLFSKQAYAAIPYDVFTQGLLSCQNNSLKYGVVFSQAQVSWISPAGQPGTDSSTSNTVTAGQSTSLQWNQATIWCNGASGPVPGAVQASNFLAVNSSVTQGQLSQLTGDQVLVNVNPNTQVSQNATGFTFIAPSGASSATITITYESLNQFSQPYPVNGGEYECVGAPPGGPYTPANGYWRTSITDFSTPTSCGNFSVSYTIPITAKSATGSINGEEIEPDGTPISSSSSVEVIDWTTGQTSTNNPFNFINVPAGSDVISATTPAGYTLDGSTWCNSNTSCNLTAETSANNFNSANTTTVNVTGGSAVQMRWIYTPIGCPSGDSGTPPDCIVPTTTSSPCPTFPGYNNVDVSLPDEAPSNAAPSGATTTPGQTTNQNVPENKTNITDITDISTGGTALNLWPSALVSQSYQQAVLTYSQYVSTYPYDLNQPNVTYNSYYDQTPWTTSSTPSYYTCNSVDTGGGSSSTCTHTSTTTGSGTTTGTPPKTTTTYTCPAGYSGGGSSSTCTETSTYTGQAWYDWSAGTTTDGLTVSNTVNGPLMPACFNRTFSLTPQNNSASYSSTITPAHPSEDPTSASYSGTINATFGETSPPNPSTALRVASQIDNITAIVTVQVYRHTTTGGTTAEPYYPTSPAGYTTTVNIYATSTNVPSSGSTSVSHTWTVSMPPLQYGDEVCFSLSDTPSTGQMSPNSPTAYSPSTVIASTAQPWNPQPLVSGGSNTATPPACTSYAAAHPYFKIFSGDAMAGIGMQQLTGTSEACNPHNGAKLEGWNQLNYGSPPDDYAGAGTSLAAFALNTINGFASAQNDPGGESPPTGLSFANSPLTSPFGGSFGPLNNNECAPDYYNQGVNGDGGVGNAIPTGSLSSAIAQGSGSYYVPGGGTIDSSLLDTELNKGQNITIYTDSSVTISNNINYPVLTSTTPTQLPGFTLVVKRGDINIYHKVSNLAGDFITSGTINTCADIPPQDMLTNNPLTANCSTQLTVDGAFNASHIDLLRTYQSLHFAKSNGIGTNAAEVFNYNPMLWLTTPTKILPPKVESITGLPPVL